MSKAYIFKDEDKINGSFFIENLLKEQVTSFFFLNFFYSLVVLFTSSTFWNINFRRWKFTLQKFLLFSFIFLCTALFFFIFLFTF